MTDEQKVEEHVKLESNEQLQEYTGKKTMMRNKFSILKLKVKSRFVKR